MAEIIAQSATAQKQWEHSTTAEKRSKILHKWADLIDKNIEDLAIILTTEQGKPLAEAVGEIRYANSFIRWFAEEGKRVYGDVIPAKANSLRYV
ncbi:MAG: aldehyde dehydrogenase family protein, partial [Gammaproteobacteria bacterium]|nr:aldehyde dehydrogenase family protein [Gammaproteobacteria bacterium]